MKNDPIASGAAVTMSNLLQSTIWLQHLGPTEVSKHFPKLATHRHALTKARITVARSDISRNGHSWYTGVINVQMPSLPGVTPKLQT